ncbi:14760_t:CDS:2, partial [Racocetra persica]
KRTGQDLTEALEQAKNYARKRNSPIAYAIIETALHFIDKNEYNPRKIIAIKDREKLIKVFSFANNQLRDDGLTEGHERFTSRKKKKEKTNDVQKAKLSLIDSTEQSKYGADIFQHLQIRNPATLKRIIDKLTSLQLTSIDIDVKGEAFEYFLKEAIKGQKKDLGQYFTPRHIVDFLVKLADPKPHETIYDPFLWHWRHSYQ